MPLGETFISLYFGMAGDKFGVLCMIVVMPPEAKTASESLSKAAYYGPPGGRRAKIACN